MDGVVIDSHPAHRRAWQKFLGTVGREVTEAELDFVLDGRKREEILRYFLGELEPSKIAQYGTLKDEMLQQLGEGLRPLPGIMEFLNSLSHAGMRMALATSAGRTRSLVCSASFFNSLMARSVLRCTTCSLLTSTWWSSRR